MNLGVRIQLADSLRNASHIEPKKLDLDWPKGLVPVIMPSTKVQKADVIVMVDTVDEATAAASVLTPGMDRRDWQKYTTNYDKYSKLLTDKSPARFAHALGEYQYVNIGDKRVMVYKTELHMHEDGPSLPLKSVIGQLIAEVKPMLFLSTGTAGGVSASQQLGDVVINNTARFMTKKDYATLNGKLYTNKCTPSRQYMAQAIELMKSQFGTIRDGYAKRGKKLNREYPYVLTASTSKPVLTTDYFEYGTTKNDLDKSGSVVEMDDAVIGWAISEMTRGPQWLSVRNVSDPVIDGELSEPDQMKEATYWYSHFGYWTSVNSALAAWAIVLGL